MAVKIRRDDTVRSSPARTAAAPAGCCALTRANQKVYVEGANIVKRHMRPRTLRDTQRAQEMGGIVEMEGRSTSRT